MSYYVIVVAVHALTIFKSGSFLAHNCRGSHSGDRSRQGAEADRGTQSIIGEETGEFRFRYSAKVRVAQSDRSTHRHHLQFGTRSR